MIKNITNINNTKGLVYIYRSLFNGGLNTNLLDLSELSEFDFYSQTELKQFGLKQDSNYFIVLPESLKFFNDKEVNKYIKDQITPESLEYVIKHNSDGANYVKEIIKIGSNLEAYL